MCFSSRATAPADVCVTSARVVIDFIVLTFVSAFVCTRECVECARTLYSMCGLSVRCGYTCVQVLRFHLFIGRNNQNKRSTSREAIPCCSPRAQFTTQRTFTEVYAKRVVPPVFGCVNRSIRHAANQEQSLFSAEKEM